MEKDNLYKEINNFRSKKERESATSSDKNGNSRSIQARILWPALGFPAVISPRENAPADSLLYGDATKCISVLVLTNKPNLTKEQAAMHLRFVPWNDRAKRYIAQGETGSFSEKDLIVISTSSRKMVLPEMKDMHGFGIVFGGDKNGNNAITVKQANFVNDFYKKCGLNYLYEIRVSERMSKQLNDGQYNLFWNSDIENNKDRPSAEMNLLLDHYAKPEREKIYDNILKQSSETYPPKDSVLDAGQLIEGNFDYFFRTEYEYEYGSLKSIEVQQLSWNNPVRTEILHPIFIQKTQQKKLEIAHITDLHVSTRENVYEKNLKASYSLNKYEFNNWNTSFVNAYEKAKKSQANALLFTGDLIDYGRGYLGNLAQDRLGNDGYYHADRNWFLFYSLLVSGNSYSKPVFTILGNHDWRINPYPPFAFGATNPRAFFHNHLKIDSAKTKEEKKLFPYKTKDALKIAHGMVGADNLASYTIDGIADFIGKNGWDATKLLWNNSKTFDHTDLPSETNTEAIGWYLMAINPFLDYSFSLNDDTKILMLDWAEDENLLFPITENGKDERFGPIDLSDATDPGPKTKNSITSFQSSLINKFTAMKGKAKIIGIHAPPIGPYSSWTDEDMLKGKKIFKPDETFKRLSDFADKLPGGKIVKWNGHPIYAIKPDNVKYAAGTFADYGSLDNHRDWFIKSVNQPAAGITAVLSGHIHRNGIYQVYQHDANDKKQPLFAGQYFVKSYYASKDINSPQQVYGMSNYKARTPLFINTTSAGPRGNIYTDEIKKGDPKPSADPGLALIDINENGRIEQIKFLSSRTALDKRGNRVNHKQLTS